MIAGTQQSINGLLDGAHHNGPFQTYGTYIQPRDYLKRKFRLYSPPPRIVQGGLQPFLGTQERGLEIERCIIDEIIDVPRLMRDVDPHCRTYMPKKTTVTPAKSLPTGPSMITLPPKRNPPKPTSVAIRRYKKTSTHQSANDNEKVARMAAKK